MSAVEQDPQPLPEQQSSVSIEDSAKGPRVAVKVYNPDVAMACDQACRTYADTIAWLQARGLRGAV